ncbi:MAG: IS1595 family transposase [Bacteroidota bacterium]
MQPFALADFFARYGTEEQCLSALRVLRWPPEVFDGGIPCKKCEVVRPHHLIASRRCYSCQVCGTQVRPTVGTLFERSRVPLLDWFYVLYLTTRLPEAPTAKQIQREIGVSYPTALRMRRRIQANAEEASQLAAQLFQVALPEES